MPWDVGHSRAGAVLPSSSVKAAKASILEDHKYSNSWNFTSPTKSSTSTTTIRNRKNKTSSSSSSAPERTSSPWSRFISLTGSNPAAVEDTTTSPPSPPPTPPPPSNNIAIPTRPSSSSSLRLSPVESTTSFPHRHSSSSLRRQLSDDPSFSPESTFSWLASTSPPDSPHSILSAILTADQSKMVGEEQVILRRLHDLLVEMEAPEGDLDILEDAISQVDDLFMVCVVGEYNAGKSTFINALLGNRYQNTGLTPTTARICTLKHEERRGNRTRYSDAQGQLIDDTEEKYLPLDYLHNLALVDTPGTNSINVRHSQLTYRIVPRADAVIFVTSAVQPFSDSERNFLVQISQWYKKVVLVVNKMDLLQSEEEQDQIVDYVRTNARKCLGGHHDITLFPVSSRLALDAKLVAAPCPPAEGVASSAWHASRFEDLESFLSEILTDEEKIRSKLLNPLGVADNLIQRSLVGIKQRKKIVMNDMATLSLIDEQMEQFMRDMARDVRAERLAVDEAIRCTVTRADEFFRRHTTLANVQGLLDTRAFQRTFQEQVIGKLETSVGEIIRDMCALLAERAQTQSRCVLDFLGRRSGDIQSRMVGTVTETRFEGVRHQVLEKLQVDVKDVMVTYDKDKEADKLSESVRCSLYQTAVLQAGALTTGGLAAAHAVSMAGGLLAASTLAMLGCMAVPYQMARTRADFQHRIEEIRKQLESSLTTRLDRELHKVRERILECIAPYRRFVLSEEEKLKRFSEDIREIDQRLGELRRRIH